MKGKKLLPLILAVLTVLVLAAALWPHKTPMKTYVVASRDLGAGTALTASDLTTVTAPAAQVPPDAVSDPKALVGKTLAVVRFEGEPVTPRHLGPAVALKPDERGVAVRVRKDTGLAGLLRPGMKVGVAATLKLVTGNDVYAKAILEGLRVLYVPPSFQAAPETPVTAQAVVEPGKKKSAAFEGAPVVSSRKVSDEGVVVLAAGTKPAPVLYVPEEVERLVAAGEVSVLPTGEITVTDGISVTEDVKEDLKSLPDRVEVKYVSPVELLEALNAVGNSLALYLMPQKPEDFSSSGVDVRSLIPITATEASPETAGLVQYPAIGGGK